MAGMVVQHNLNAINANNKLNMNVIGTKKATEKLSSGYKINRAGDNAAGLAISEKMRAQIRGLSQAVNNANDGISLIQTAEGGLNETHAILQRMRELAVQASNGTYQQEDRDAMQLEVDALKSEIDRISDSTEYNGIKLLDGSLSGASAANGDYGPRYAVYLSNNDETAILADANLSLEGSYITSSVHGVTVNLIGEDGAGASAPGAEIATWSEDGMILDIKLYQGQTYTQSQINKLISNATQAKTLDQGNPIPKVEFVLKTGSFTFDTDVEDTFITNTGVRAQSSVTDLTADFIHTGDAPADTYANQIMFTSNNYGTDTRVFSLSTDVGIGKEWVEKTSGSDDNEALGIKDGTYTIHLATGKAYSEADIQNIMAKSGLDYTVTLSDTTDDGTNFPPNGDKKFYSSIAVASDSAVEIATMQNGDGVGSDRTQGTGKGLIFQIGANGVEDQRVTLSVDNMDATAIGVNDIDVSSEDKANEGIDAIDKAVNTVSLQRAGLGALQNRLEYTVNNLTTTGENLTAAESQIRDTDMATEMINYTKFNILQQAAQAMLAQANQAPQAVLQLLG